MQNKQTDAIVAGTRQQLCQVYEAEQALCRGTLFPELDKPLSGVRCDCSPCATREHAHDFAAWELRLYLNTNPADQQALKLYRQHCAKMNGRGYAAIDAPVQQQCHHNGQRNFIPRQECAAQRDCGGQRELIPCQECAAKQDCAPRQGCTAQALRAYACENDISFTRRAKEDVFIRVDEPCHAAPAPCAPAKESCEPVDVWTWNDAPWPWEKCACRKEG